MVLVQLKGVKKQINTADGVADYQGTEIENEYGKWNDSYQTKHGEWVIHEGKKHHIYYSHPNRAPADDIVKQIKYGFGMGAINKQAINKLTPAKTKKILKMFDVRKETGAWN